MMTKADGVREAPPAPSVWRWITAGMGLAGLVGLILLVTLRPGGDRAGSRPPPPAPSSVWVVDGQAEVLDLLADDRIEDKNPRFDPALVDSRLHDGWQVNASAAVLGLDIADVGEAGPQMAVLYPSYAAAAQALTAARLGSLLPSINLLHGKTRQFDEGLLAAVLGATVAAPAVQPGRPAELLTRLLGRLPADSEAAAWVCAALELGAHALPSGRARPAGTTQLVQRFLASKEAVPIGFYGGTPELERLWRFLRFIQLELPAGIADPLRRAIASDPALADDYRRMLVFLGRLSNPPAPGAGPLSASGGLYFLPSMGTQEDALFARLAPGGRVAPDVDLMQAFVRAIRSGAVDLRPRAGSGWYDYQIHAFETFLLAERGREHGKLLLTRAYKQRQLEAFKALVARTRELHVGMGGFAGMAEPPPMRALSPRLRVEPNPTYYLRVARSYAFVDTILRGFLPADELQALHGWREGGRREPALAPELASMRQLFYGLYLLAAEDIGLAAELLAGELPDPPAARAAAERYLATWQQDPDLAADTRACVPVAVNRAWCTIGVKVLRLRADYARPPSGRPAGADGAWTAMATEADVYLLLADEFAELARTEPLPRKAMRAIADRAKTRAAIVDALGH